MTTVTTPLAFAALTGRRANLQAFGSLLLRDVRVMRRNVVQFLVRTIMQPLLFAFVFSYVFPKIGQSVGGGGSQAPSGPSFSTIIVPGLMAMAIIFTGIQAVALPLVQEFSYTKEIEDRVLAPLPIWAVGLGKVVAGALQAMLAAIITFPIVYFVHAGGQAPDIHVQWPMLVLVLVLASFLGAAFGLLIGSSFAPPDVPLLFSIIVLPMSMLGCIYYPWASLSEIAWLKWTLLVNPLVYMSEGLRAALVGRPHMPAGAFLSAMVVLGVALGTLALRNFHKRVVT